ncbi:MAG: Protein acetyltransferase [Mycobacterium sp.]|nr:Protein acetyltransferase [Mycobacterium sp.]
MASVLNQGTLQPLANEAPTVATREPSLAAWIASISEGTFVPANSRTHLSADTSSVLIRPMESSDGALLTEGFARLSARSRRLRFHGAKVSLTQTDIDHLTDIDHREREALVALSEADGRGIGIARYNPDTDDPEIAEIAVTVIDDWQHRGIGTELLKRLSERAHDKGICRFSAIVTNDNPAVVNLLHSLNRDVTVLDRDRDTTEYLVMLVPSQSREPERTCC